jgi:hypothetical protein
LQCNSAKMLAHHRTGKKHLAKLNGCWLQDTSTIFHFGDRLQLWFIRQVQLILHNIY